MFIVGCIQLMGTALFVFGFKYWTNFRRLTALSTQMKAIPRSLIGERDRAFIEIEGLAIGIKDKELKSPLTQRDCIFWEIKVLSTKDNQVLHIMRSSDPFFIKDPSGVAMVCHDKRTRHLTQTEHRSTTELDEVVFEKLRTLLKGAGISHLPSDMSIVENILLDKTPIYLTGNIMAIPGPFQERMAKSLAKGDLESLARRLDRIGTRYQWMQSPVGTAISVGGHPIKGIRNADSLNLDLSSHKTVGHYLFGTQEHNMFVSSITETMVEGNDPIDLYDISAKSIGLLAASILIFLACATQLFE